LRLQFILGGPGSGKTTLMHKEIASAQSAGGNNSLILIVPEQYSFQSEKALIAAAGGAISRARVLSFQRLSYFVLGKTGGIGKTILEGSGKNMILRKIVSRFASEFGYFKSGHDTVGFLDNLATSIAEFYHYDISPEDLYERAQRMSETPLGIKLSDLQLIYSEYRKFLEENFISSDEILDILAQKIPAADFLRRSEIWIDGFKSFTPQEKKVLSALFKAAKVIKITLPLSPTGKNTNTTKNDVYYEISDTMAKITQLANEIDVKIEESIVLDESYRHKTTNDLAFLCENFLDEASSRASSKVFDGMTQNIRIAPCENIFTEIEDAAKTISWLTRSRGYKYSEIGIIAADLATYAKYVPTLFARFDIPVFVDARRSVIKHPIAQMLLAACGVVSSNWSYEAVFRLLRLPMFGQHREDFDMLENFILASNIRGQKAWSQDFTGDNMEAINAARVKVVNIMQPLSQKFTPRRKFALQDFAMAMYEFLIHNGIQSALDKWMDAATLIGDNESLRWHEQIWGNIMQVLEKIVEILPDFQENIAGFAKILEAGFADMGLAPPSLDQLVMGDLRRSRFGEIKALLILGAKDGAMPSRGDDGASLFSDEDRAKLQKSGLTIAKDSTQKMYEENFLIYTNFSKPTEFLNVSYPIGDLSGRGASPAQCVQRIVELFPNRNTHEDIATSCTKSVFSELVEAMGQSILANTAVEPYLQQAYNFFANNAYFAAKLSEMEKGIGFSLSSHRLSKPTIDALYPKDIHTSVSKLQRYVSCPFSYFVEYNLSAKKRKIYEVAAVDIGNIYHDILARFGDILQQLDKDEAMDESQLASLVDAAIDEVLDDPTNDLLKSTGLYRHFAQKMRDISKVSAYALVNHLTAGDFKVAHNEVAFGLANPNEDLVLDAIEISLESGNAKMLLQGRIDRVDIGEIDDAEYVKVIDYKSGKKQFSLDEVYHGLDMQLLMYLGAFVEKMAQTKGDAPAKKILPAAAFYFNLLNPMLDYDASLDDPNVYTQKLLEKFKMSGLVLDDDKMLNALDADAMSFKKGNAVISAEDFTRLMQHTRRLAKRAGEDILAGNIDISPCHHDKKTPCGFCDYRSICKFDASNADNYRILPSIKNNEVLAILDNK